MAVLKRNYVPGESEVITQVEAGTVVSGEYQYFSLEGYFKFEIADPVIYATALKTLVDPADYDLLVDTKYTSLEAGYSTKTLNAQIRFTNPAYDGEPFYVSGLNFGTMVDNEEMKRYVDANSGSEIVVYNFTDENVSVQNNSFNFLKTTAGSGEFVYTLPNYTGENFYAGLFKKGDISTRNIVVKTENGTDLIGGLTEQVITGGSEGITVVQSDGGYDIIQDSRGASVFKLPGVIINQDYISKVDENTISIVSGDARVRKSDNSVEVIGWGDSASVPVTIADGELQWVYYKWNVGETALELAFMNNGASSVLDYEKVALIGRVWRDAGVLKVGSRHIGLSVDPNVSRTFAWAEKSSNISVVALASTVDTNLLAFADGELYRWPVVQSVTNHHLWPFAGDVGVVRMWDHLQGQSGFSIVSDNEVGDYSDIREISNYWDNGGAYDTVAGNRYGLHLVGVYAGSNEYVLVRSQYLYTNIRNAKIGIGSDPIVLSDWASDFDQISFVSWVVIQGGTTDFSDTSRVSFVPYEGGAGGGASGISQSYDHATQFGRKGSNNFPADTDIDLPVTWFEEDPAGTWGFDGITPNPDATLPALLNGDVVGFTVNFETLTSDIEFGFKVDGVKFGQTWTILAAEEKGQAVPIQVPYLKGQSVIPYCRHTATWGGTGIRCIAYSRGVA